MKSVRRKVSFLENWEKVARVAKIKYIIYMYNSFKNKCF